MDAKIKKGKKKWFSIAAPKLFKNIDIGETLAYDGKELIGRKLGVGLMQLTGDPKRQNMEVSLRINHFDGNLANTETIGYFLVKSYVRRLVRKDSKKIDESYRLELKDKDKILIKPLIITRGKTNNSVITALRKNTYEFLQDYCKKNDFEKLFFSVVDNKLQRDLQKFLNKTYPVAICQFRIVERI